MTDSATVERLRRRGEVPPPSSDDRRAWLGALTLDELLALTRRHGTDQTVFSDCLGWGAHHAGTEWDDPGLCSRCGRAGMMLYFMVDGAEVARCWTCSAVDHLTGCDLWEMP